MKLKLIIEIDGLIHIQNKEIDRFRQGELENLGFRFLRFTNCEIEKNINYVIQKIKEDI
ncbi:MAG: DUF559 domain-containing protein [Patescibacteria group bacterium]